MTRLLYFIHRWVGLGLALFMSLWFFSGLVSIYAGMVTAGRAQQLAHAESLAPEAGWLSAGEAWERSAEARQIQSGKGGEAGLAAARLLRIAGEPYWLVEDAGGHRFALSARDGHPQRFTGVQAEAVARQWLAAGQVEGGSLPALAYRDSPETVSSLRNYADYKPFLRVAVADGAGTELLVSAVTGEVLQAATRWQRGLYLAGNWLHLFRPLDLLGLGESRRDVLMWTVSAAFAATLTGLIVGWLRWRPGWFGRPTYGQGRTQPYRTFWLRWHFWTGLIGGSFALLWSFSGIVNSNPWQVFSAAAVTRPELARFQGGDLPAAVRDWRPQQVEASVVELAWRPLGGQAVLLAYDRGGRRLPQEVPGAVGRFDEPVLLAAAQRLGGGAPVAARSVQASYDSYYYPTHRQTALDKPLPVLRVDLADAGQTHLYLDPQDGRLLLKQDASRRAYRWLFSALHFWDIGLLYSRPLWDLWSLTWIGLGLVMSVSSVVLGWRLLKRKARSLRPREEEAGVPPVLAARGATQGVGGES